MKRIRKGLVDVFDFLPLFLATIFLVVTALILELQKLDANRLVVGGLSNFLVLPKVFVLPTVALTTIMFAPGHADPAQAMTETQESLRSGSLTPQPILSQDYNDTFTVHQEVRRYLVCENYRDDCDTNKGKLKSAIKGQIPEKTGYVLRVEYGEGSLSFSSFVHPRARVWGSGPTSYVYQLPMPKGDTARFKLLIDEKSDYLRWED